MEHLLRYESQRIPEKLEKYFVLVVVVGEAVVDLDGVHHEEVADEGDDELGAPVARPAEESSNHAFHLQ